MDVQRVCLIPGFFSKLVYTCSTVVTDGFIRVTEELNARIFPTTIAIEQSSSHAYLVQVLKGESVFISALCTLHSEQLLPAAARSNSRPPSDPKRATYGSKTKLARCTETNNRPELNHPLSKRSLGNAPFLRASFFLAEKGTVWVRVSN